MDTKLTLKLNKSIIEKAKEYAALHNVSLSRMIESYLQSLVDKETKQEGKIIEISPFVKSMATGVKIPNDLDLKTEYRNSRFEKHQ